MSDFLTFEPELGSLPRKASFWLDDLFFWTPIVLEVSGLENLPRDLHIHVRLGWGGDVKYDASENLLTIPVGVACGTHNEYVTQLGIKPSAQYAYDVEPKDFCTLWGLYHNWGVDKKPWLENVIFKSLVHFRFSAFCHFLATEIDRTAWFAGDFVDAVLKLSRSTRLSVAKRTAIRNILTEEPGAMERQRAIVGKYVFFISHASEDKEKFVRPLVREFDRRQVPVWYDELALKVGDSLRKSIDRGLAEARFGVVILSKQFFAKNWPQYELDGLVAREASGGKIILPIWHNVTKAEVCAYSPTLADKVALDTSCLSVSEIVEKLIALIKDEPTP